MEKFSFSVSLKSFTVYHNAYLSFYMHIALNVEQVATKLFDIMFTRRQKTNNCSSLTTLKFQFKCVFFLSFRQNKETKQKHKIKKTKTKTKTKKKKKQKSNQMHVLMYVVLTSNFASYILFSRMIFSFCHIFDSVLSLFRQR